MASRIAHGLAGPQPLDYLQRFREAAHAIARWHGERAILGVTIAEAHPEDEAAAADHVEGGDLLRHVDGMMQR